jgi:hypothetical protein
VNRPSISHALILVMANPFLRRTGSRVSILIACRPVPLALSLRENPMLPYSDPEPEILQERFPQQSQRRAARITQESRSHESQIEPWLTKLYSRVGLPSFTIGGVVANQNTESI